MNDAKKLHAVGITHYRAGRYSEAVEAFAEARAAAETDGDRHKVAEILNDLGVAQRELTEWSPAQAALEESYALFAELGSARGKAQAMGNLGSVLEGQTLHQEAAEAYKRSAKMFEDIGDSDSAMYVWQALSRMRMKQGEWLPAIAAYEEGIEHMADRSLKKRLLKRILRLPGGLLRGQ